MSKIFSLLKATMSGGVELFQYRVKDARFRHVLPVVLGGIIAIAVFLISNILMLELESDDTKKAILVFFALLTTIIILLEGVYKSGDLLFKPRDNDLLLSMPILKTEIIFVRVFKFYLFEMIYGLIFLLPAMIAYAINNGVDVTYYLIIVTALVLIPIVPIVISCLIGLIIMSVSTKFRHKTLLQVILSFLSLVVVSVFIIMANTSSGLDEQSFVSMTNSVSSLYYPIGAFLRLVSDFDILQYLIFIGIHLVLLVLAVALIACFYFKIVNRLNVSSGVRNTSFDYRFRQHSQFFAIVKKEISRYFSTPVLLVNTAIGLVIFAVAAIMVSFRFEEIVGPMVSSENSPLSLDDIRFYMPVLTYAMVGFASLMTFITCTTFSLERKAFNTLKVLPIRAFKIIIAKVWAAMVLIMPVTIFGTLLVAFSFHFSIIDVVLLLLGVVAMPLVAELIGVLVDLKYAIFDADSDTAVVKQSAGVMVATFVGLGTFLLSLALTSLALYLVGQTAGLAIMDGLFMIVAFFLLVILWRWGEKRFMKLSA